MATSSTRPTRRQTLNIRIKGEERGLIDRAARVRGQNRTDFILEAARRAAEDTLVERTMLVVTPEAYKAFVKRLDAKPRPNARLRQTMRTKAPWDKA